MSDRVQADTGSLDLAVNETINERTPGTIRAAVTGPSSWNGPICATCGAWHDDCGYCTNRRVKGGTGVPTEADHE